MANRMRDVIAKQLKPKRGQDGWLSLSKPGRQCRHAVALSTLLESLMNHYMNRTLKRFLPAAAVLAAIGFGSYFLNVAVPGKSRNRGHRAQLSHAAGRARAIEADEQTGRSEEHTSELQSLMRITYAGFCLKKKK